MIITEKLVINPEHVAAMVLDEDGSLKIFLQGNPTTLSFNERESAMTLLGLYGAWAKAKDPATNGPRPVR